MCFFFLSFTLDNEHITNLALFIDINNQHNAWNCSGKNFENYFYIKYVGILDERREPDLFPEVCDYEREQG